MPPRARKSPVRRGWEIAGVPNISGAHLQHLLRGSGLTDRRQRHSAGIQSTKTDSGTNPRNGSSMNISAADMPVGSADEIAVEHGI